MGCFTAYIPLPVTALCQKEQAMMMQAGFIPCSCCQPVFVKILFGCQMNWAGQEIFVTTAAEESQA